MITLFNMDCTLLLKLSLVYEKEETLIREGISRHVNASQYPAAEIYLHKKMKRHMDNVAKAKVDAEKQVDNDHDGLRSHCALDDGIIPDFELSIEKLASLATEKEQKRY